VTTIADDLRRARQLSFAADEGAAKDLLLSLGEGLQDGRDDRELMEIYAQLGELYLVRTAYPGVTEAVSRIRQCLTRCDDAASTIRYTRRVLFLECGNAAAHGDHESAETALATLTLDDASIGDAASELADERRFYLTYARILCATALCDDDLHVRSVPLWEQVLDAIDQTPDPATEFDDHLLVLGATNYGRFCVETGRLGEAEPWLRRAGARAAARGWNLATARTQLERCTAAWTAGDRARAQDLVHAAYPAIAEHARAHDVSRCWLYFGLISISVGALDDADERLGHAERHWREVDKPLHIHRILLQRSWVDVMRGQFDAARAKADEARGLLDGWDRHSWLQYARLDNHLGSILRAQALAAPTAPAETFRHAAELMIPAALAVDSVRHAIADADARMRWATYVSAPILAGAFAIAHDWRNTGLLSELIEYHCARGAFSTDTADQPAWQSPATVAVPIEADDEYALVAAGPAAVAHGGLTRLGPLPPLRMDPHSGPIMSHYRALAHQRYGRAVTADERTWTTWP
jgi:hypothetical protein